MCALVFHCGEATILRRGVRVKPSRRAADNGKYFPLLFSREKIEKDRSLAIAARAKTGEPGGDKTVTASTAVWYMELRPKQHSH
jgi:hypothetical protein